MAHIFGLTYIANDNLFAVDESGGGHVNIQSAPVGASSSPITVGQMVSPDHRIYVLAEDGTISLFRGLDGLPNPTATFNVGQPTLWSLAHAHGVLYVGTGTGNTPTQGSLVALDDGTGAVLWAQQVPGPVLYPAAVAYINNTPGRIIFGTGGQDQNIHALDPATGAEVWSQPDYAFGQVVRDGILYYANLVDNSVTGRSALDGSLKWKYVSPSHSNFNLPEAYKGVVYATSEGAEAVALDAQTGAVRWETKVQPFPGGPVTHFSESGEGYVIFAVGQYAIGDSLLQALDANSGAPLWTCATSVGGPGQACTAPIMAFTGLVQVGTPDGRLVTVSAETGELVWQLQLSTEFISRPRWNWW